MLNNLFLKNKKNKNYIGFFSLHFLFLAMLRAPVVATLLLLASEAHVITIDNTKPKLDVKGEIVNAHDGTYRRFGDFFYYHGAEYGLCKEPPKLGCDGATAHGCGFHTNHNVSVWKSPDLSSGSWEKVSTAEQCSSLTGCGVLYRPHLVHNPNTDEYVLFVNYVGSDGGYKGYAVYAAASPEGPFALRNPQMNVTRLCPGPAATGTCGEAQGGCGDFDVFVDDDGQAYIIYGCNFYMSIERLTRDFYYSAYADDATKGNASAPGGKFSGTVFPDYFVEAPVMFKRGDVYYVLYGHCCCFCFQGSGIIVYTSSSPMGPWIKQSGGDLACQQRSALSDPPAASLGAIPTPNQGCLYGGANKVSSTHAQQNFVIQVPDSKGGVTFVWTGDLWQQAPDGIKGHEGQFWVPLHFTGNGTISKVNHISQFSFDVI